MKIEIKKGNLIVESETREEALALFNFATPPVIVQKTRATYKRRASYTKVCQYCGKKYKYSGQHVKVCANLPAMPIA